MSGLYGILDRAGHAMQVVQGGIATTGHNIANVNTPGYSRQLQRLQTGLPIGHPAGSIGMGVEQVSIERISDAFLHGQLVQEEASGQSLLAESQALDAVQEILNEQGGGGLSAAIARLYSAFGDLAASSRPGAAAERQALLGAARQLVDAFRRSDAQLRDQQRAADASVRGLLPEVSSLLEQIAELNGQIPLREVVAPANDFRDRRELLLRELAAKIEIRSFEEQNGSLVVMLASGPTLVEGVTARRLVGAPDPAHPFDATFTRVIYEDGSAQLDVTAQVGGGRLGGLLRARDDLIASAIRSLDVLAYNLGASVNAVHVSGFGLDGSTGLDFFAPLGAVEDAARAFAVAPGVDGAPDRIAAGGLGPEPGDRENALVLAALRDAPLALLLPGDLPGPPSGPTRSILEHAAAVTADVGVRARGLSEAVAQHERIREVLETRRDEISGVSLDEEVTHLVRLQAAFQANARMVSIVDRLLQDVVGMI